MDVLLYLFGYAGWGPHVPLMKKSFIKHNKQVRGRGLKWIDVRFKRTVRAPGFRDNAAEELLGKKHYSWIHEFGNAAYGGGGAKLVDFEAGMPKLLNEIREAEESKNDLILFCHCDSYGCHRFWLADEIKDSTKGARFTIAEWPLRDKNLEIDLRKKAVKVMPVALHISVNASIEGLATPLVIPFGTKVKYRENGEDQIWFVSRVTPSGDENTAIIKYNDYEDRLEERKWLRKYLL